MLGLLGVGPLSATGDLGNRIEGLTARSLSVDVVIAAVLSITIVFCLHYITEMLPHIYDKVMTSLRCQA